MNIIEPGFEVLDDLDGRRMLRKIEAAGRICYKSEENITDGSAEIFVRSILKNGHESVIEHEKISVRVVCDRGVSHEIVRHRIASYSQESTRYCNYSKEKFGKELTFIKPVFWEEDSKEYQLWKNLMKKTEASYNELIEMGAAQQEARRILPNSLNTEIVITMNLREWRHFFRLRTSKKAHPQMRQISRMILEYFKENIPAVFDDIDAD